MPKGQQRGNKEAKKPKQLKKPVAPLSSVLAPAQRPLPVARKKR
jgi:hypothetical protein